MGNKRTLEVVIVGDDKRLGNTLSHTEGRLSSFGSKFRTFAGGMAAGIGTAFAVDKITAFGSSLFDLGQSLEVMDVKADTVFEGQADAVRRWADANNEALGLSDEKLTGLAASFGDLLKPMGFTADEAASMSQDVLGLSGALSAWSGGQRSAAEVSEILAKAMLGEREQLKELGISIQEADVQARLAAKGQDELTGAALQQAKAIATQELIFEKSTDAQKAWSDGSMDGIQATNELKAAWADAQVVLAEKFLPAVQGTFSWIRDNVLPIVRGVIDAFEEGGLGGAIGHISEQFSLAWPQIQEALGGLVGNIGAWLAEQGPVIVEHLGVLADQVVTWIEQNGADMLARLIEAGEAFVSWIAPQIPPLLGELWKLQGRIMVWIGTEAAPLLIGKLVEWAGAFVGWIATDLLPRLPGELLKITGALGEWIRNTAAPWLQTEAAQLGESMLAWIRGLPGQVASLASGAFDGLVDALKDTIRALAIAWNEIDLTFTVPDIPGVPRRGERFDIIPDVPVPSFHSGGVVPGRPGQEILALVQAGETILPANYSTGGGSITIIEPHFTIYADALTDADRVAERIGTAMRRYIDTGGRLPPEALGA